MEAPTDAWVERHAHSTPTDSAWSLDLARDGCAVLRGFLSPTEVESLRTLLAASSGPGRRDLLESEEVARWAWSSRLCEVMRTGLSGEPFPVRALYFNKSPDVNWLVPWHQDLTIAVVERRDVAGFGPSSVKDGVPHVQPPVELLERMLSIRLQLDDSDETNGGLRFAPGSHALGRLSAERIAELRADDRATCLRLAAGDAFLMRPLLLHASGRSTNDRPRRVLHIEYAGFVLPGGLAWRSVEPRG